MLVSYGYDPLEDWSNDGIADIEAGGRYQYFNSDKWRLAFTGALRFPTGDQDIDSLASFDHGEGAWAILMHSNNDYVGIDNLILNATFRFEYVFEYDEKVRVPAEGEMLTSNKENVDIDPGNVIEIELSGKYTFDNGFGIAALYEYGKRFEDDISGDNNHSYYTILELDSDAKSHIYMVSLSYSTLNLFLEKKFPVPLNVAIGYRNRFAGENTLKSEYISLGATVYF